MGKYLSSSRKPENIINCLLYLCLIFLMAFGFIIVSAEDGSGQSKASNKIDAAINLLLLSDDKEPKGKVMFWSKVGDEGSITIYVDGSSVGALNWYFTSTPAFGASGGLTLELSVGTHSLTATSDAGTTWSDTFTITEGGSLLWQLRGTTDGGGDGDGVECHCNSGEVENYFSDGTYACCPADYRYYNNVENKCYATWEDAYFGKSATLPQGRQTCP